MGELFDSVSLLANYLGINRRTLSQRMEYKWPQERWGEKKHTYEITYQGKIYKSISDLAKYLGINEDTLSARIRDGLSEEEWGDVRVKTKISVGYTWEEAPKHLKEAAERLAIGLNISALEAYQLLLEKIDFANL